MHDTEREKENFFGSILIWVYNHWKENSFTLIVLHTDIISAIKYGIVHGKLKTLRSLVHFKPYSEILLFQPSPSLFSFSLPSTCTVKRMLCVLLVYGILLWARRHSTADISLCTTLCCFNVCFPARCHNEMSHTVHKFVQGSVMSAES